MRSSALPCRVDMSLAGLGPALDPLAVGRQLIAAGVLDPTSRVVGVQILKHKPGKRCSFAYAIDRNGSRERLFAKTFRRRRAERSFLRHSRIFEATHGSPDLYVPRPLAHLPELKLLVTEFIDGRAGGEALYDRGGRLFAEKSARAIRAVHRAVVALDADWTSADELSATERQLGHLGREDAALARRLIDSLARLAPQASPSVAIHRDFYPEQLLESNGRAALIDLDDVRNGDPAVDVGNYLAHLRLRALQRPRRQRACALARVAFLDTYLGELAPDANDAALQARLHFYEATSLTRLAGLYAGREQSAEALPAALLRAARGVLA